MHFEDSQFTNTEKTRLNGNARPTIFNVPNPPNSVSSKRRAPKERNIAVADKSKFPISK